MFCAIIGMAILRNAHNIPCKKCYVHLLSIKLTDFTFIISNNNLQHTAFR